MNNCEQTIRPKLTQHFGSNLDIDSADGDCRVVFPFQRVDGDPVILYVVEQNGQYKITDEGSTHGMLWTSGVTLDSGKAMKRTEAIEERFDLDAAPEELAAFATEESLAERMLDVLQAALAMSFIVYTRKTHSPSKFSEKVSGYLHGEGIDFRVDYTEDVDPEPQQVDFYFPQAPQPTYMDAIQARDGSDLHKKSRDTGYTWMKIRDQKPNSTFISLVDDDGGEYQKERMHPLYDDSDHVLAWSDRAQLPSLVSG